MKIFRDIADFSPDRKSAISIGNFDGVHAGHRKLLGELKRKAAKHGFPSAVVTFDPHPIEVLIKDSFVPRLTTLERKAELLKKCGVDCLVVLRTNQELLNLDHVDFFNKYVLEKLNAGAMVEGPNFYFGKDRIGTTERLAELCSESGVDLSIVEIDVTGQGVTSSSSIRRLIQQGKVQDANRLLIENYQLEGRVVSGAARGREIGFPTANLTGVNVLIPGEGVYAGRALIEDRRCSAAIHIGPNPTFDDEQQKVEVHLIGQDHSLYEQTLKVDVLKRVRGIEKFNSKDELVSQIRQDLDEIETFLKDCP